MSASQQTNSRIKHALYSTAWRPGQDTFAILEATATRLVIEDCVASMVGYLYCPRCYTALTRTPREKACFTNGRRATFAHLPSNRHVACDLRSTKPEGKLFLTEEEAKKAIADHELVEISGFLDEQPESPDRAGIYDQSAVEDVGGPVSEVPISRHRGRAFKLPTRLSSVASICRRLDRNLYRYFVFPGTNVAVLLADA